MTDQQLLRTARIGLRIALGATFLSAVASRLGFWGSLGGNWERFLPRVAQLNWFLPASLIPVVAIVATALEISFGVLLIAGWRLKWVGLGSAALLMWFAVAMVFGDNVKSPLDYSVFVDSFAALLLAATARHEPV